MEKLVLATLEEDGQTMQGKTVARPGTVVQCKVELLNSLHDPLDRWGEVQTGWQR